MKFGRAQKTLDQQISTNFFQQKGKGKTLLKQSQPGRATDHTGYSLQQDEEAHQLITGELQHDKEDWLAEREEGQRFTRPHTRQTDRH